jgi:hypothetical protein
MITYRSGESVSEFVKSHTGVQGWMGQYICLGIEIDGELKAGVVYDGYSGWDINMHMAIDDRRAVSRKTLKVAFTFPFITLACRRITGLVPSKNVKARRFDEHLGFVLEGVKKCALEDDDELIYGMVKENCRWI